MSYKEKEKRTTPEEGHPRLISDLHTCIHTDVEENLQE